MVKAGSGYEFDFEILPIGTNLRELASVTAVVEIAVLPKAIGGEAISIREDGKEDETYTRGVEHPTWSALVKSVQQTIPITSE